MTQEEMDQALAVRREWSDTLRSHCYTRCERMFPSHKDSRMCGEGCDSFFDFLV